MAPPPPFALIEDLAAVGVTFQEPDDDSIEAVEAVDWSAARQTTGASIREEKLTAMKHLEEPDDDSIEAVEAVDWSAARQTTGASIREEKLTAMKHLEVESDIIQGISVQKTLRRFGRLWMTSPSKLSETEKLDCWEKSIKVTAFNVFFSHTWLTSGKWKVLSLLFQLNWPQFMAGWVIGVLAAIPLHLSQGPGVLSYTCESFEFEAECQLHLYAHYFGMIGWIVALVAAPYLPRFRRDTCFLDVASINQVDADLMERGIYAIGGFLSVSTKLQILWSRPYFSRLWCVFELAAFRTCNPKGLISLTPLFVEAAVACCIVLLYLHTSLNWLLRVWGWDLQIAFVLRLFVLLPGIHYCRTLLHEKRQMINDLRNFELSKVQCTNGFDEMFIHAGIKAWYGSADAFTSYIRGPLADELAEPFSTFQVPKAYWALIAAPLAGFQTCWVLAMIAAEAPRSAVLWECARRSSSVFLDLIFVKFAVIACDYFAPPASWNRMKTSGVWIGLVLVMFCIWQGVILWERQGKLGTLFSSLSVSFLAMLFIGDVGQVLFNLYRNTIRRPIS